MFAQQQAPQKAAGGTLTIDLTAMQKPWTGDLDGMLEAKDLELERDNIMDRVMREQVGEERTV